jgi:hypothetical protein
MAPKRVVTKEMQAGLDALRPAYDDYERLTYAAHAAKVKWLLLIRRARAQNNTLKAISAEAGVCQDVVYRICIRPEPDLNSRPRWVPARYYSPEAQQRRRTG